MTKCRDFFIGIIITSATCLICVPADFKAGYFLCYVIDIIMTKSRNLFIGRVITSTTSLVSFPTDFKAGYFLCLVVYVIVVERINYNMLSFKLIFTSTAIDNTIVRAISDAVGRYVVFYYCRERCVSLCRNNDSFSENFTLTDRAITHVLVRAVVQAIRVNKVFYPNIRGMRHIAFTLITVEDIVDINLAYLLRFPPRRIVEDAVGYIFNAIGERYYNEIRKSVVFLKCVDGGCAVLSTDACNSRIVFLVLNGREEIFGNYGIYTKNKSKSFLGICAYVIEYVVIFGNFRIHTRCNIDVLNARAFIEGGVTPVGYITEDDKRYDAFAIRECRVTKVGNVFGENKLLYADAVLECRITYSCKLFRELDFRERNIVSKCHITESGNSVGHFDLSKRGAVVKRLICNGHKALAKINRGKR